MNGKRFYNFYKKQGAFTIEKIRPKFSLKFIMAIDDWQNYGASDKYTLKEILKLNIPHKYKICDQPIYRAIGIEKDAKFISPHIGSWTLDLQFAKNFIKSDWFKENNDKYKDIVLLKVGRPKKNNIILNIDTLWKDEDFVESFFYYQQKANYVNNGGLDLEDSQREVIYRSDKINRNQIQLFWNRDKKKWERKVPVAEKIIMEFLMNI